MGVIQLRTSAAKLYEGNVQQNIRALLTLMEVLERDPTLHAALARRDRAALLQLAAPLYDDMNRNFGITHFYFTGPDRVNLLRVHHPLRHGDVINRVTTLNAETSGAISSGLELGPLGQFTLRLVAPWYDPITRKLIGYVEIGMEIDHILEHVHNLFDVEIYVLIQKKFVNRKTWEEGMRALGRLPEWDQFPDAVLSVQGPHELPEELASQFKGASFGKTNENLEMFCGGHPCQAMLIPLADVSGLPVAQLAMLADTTQQVNEAKQSVRVASVASIISGIILFVFFFWQVGRVGERIENDEQKLHDLASRDGLTGLYNHRTFYSMLEDEVARTHRYNRSVALLMLDIDHFKRVNGSSMRPDIPYLILVPVLVVREFTCRNK